MESPTYWGAILAAAPGRRPRRPRAHRSRRARPRRAGPRVRRDRRAAVLRAADLREPHRGAVVGRARASRSSTWCATHGAFLVEDDWAHDFGITTDAAPGGRPRRRRPRRLPALADQERLPGPAHRRGRSRADRPASASWPTAAPSRCTSAACSRQPPSTSSPSPPGGPTCAACASSSGPAATCWSPACASTPPGRTSSTCPAGGLNLWARLPDGTDLDQLVRDCERARGRSSPPATEWFPAEAAGPFIRLNYSGPNPAAFPEGARILGKGTRPPAPGVRVCFPTLLAHRASRG